MHEYYLSVYNLQVAWRRAVWIGRVLHSVFERKYVDRNGFIPVNRCCHHPQLSKIVLNCKFIGIRQHYTFLQ